MYSEVWFRAINDDRVSASSIENIMQERRKNLLVSAAVRMQFRLKRCLMYQSFKNVHFPVVMIVLQKDFQKTWTSHSFIDTQLPR